MRNFMFKSYLKIGVAAVLLAVVSSSYADIYGFYNITNNSATNAAAGEAQLTVDVTDPAGANNALFTFNNVGPSAMSITDIYFDDGTLLGMSTITNSSGVSFSVGANPGNLPGGNTLSPTFDATFSADSNAPAQPNGVNPGESVSFLFTLQNGQEYGTVLGALGNGSLRIGIHVQGFADGGSESFVTAIPEPEIYAMMAAGLGLMGFVVSRRRQQADA